MHITVESAIELDQSQKDELKQKISSQIGEPVNLSFTVDRKILGGLRIITPKKTIDLSIKAKLNQLETTLSNQSHD